MFDKIIGNDEIKNQLNDALKNGRISHAYIISGPDGAGKNLFAEDFAYGLVGKREGYTPDIVRLVHEKPRTITVSDIRSQVTGDAQIRPYDAEWKVYIIDDAQKMNEAAQNALLKTLEEPPQYVVILLLTTNPNVFLPTITSRCVSLSLRPVPDDDITKFLIDNYAIDPNKASVCASFSQGNVGKAVLLASSEDFAQIKSSACTLAKNARNMDASEFAQAIRQINDYHMDLSDYLDILTVWFRDVLRFKATQDANDLIFKDETMDVKKEAEKSSYAGIEEIISSIQRAGERLRANVNYDLTMELLLETIKENQK